MTKLEIITLAWIVFALLCLWLVAWVLQEFLHNLAVFIIRTYFKEREESQLRLLQKGIDKGVESNEELDMKHAN